jgi:hypothetical protein
LPDDIGAALFYAWPPHEDWQYLGVLTNDKPSTICRLQRRGFPGMFDGDGNLLAVPVVIGISLESADALSAIIQANQVEHSLGTSVQNSVEVC